MEPCWQPFAGRTEAAPMRIQSTKPLFAWDSLEDSPTLKTIQQTLDFFDV